MNFGRIQRGNCINVPTPPDPRCSDPAFALANPTICPATPTLVIKPGDALTCALGSIQFKAFSVTNGVETDVSLSTIWATSNGDIALIGAISGNCTGTGAGNATISATYNGITATALLTVIGGGGGGSNGCCSAQSVGMMVVVDQSRSMSQAFGASYSTKLDYAKAAATRWINEVNATKDAVGLITFDAVDNSTLSDLSQDTAAVAALVPGIAQTQQLTSFYTALNSAINALNAYADDLKVIFLISDGQDTSGGAANGYANGNNPIALLSNFKAAGGIVICLGTRASGNGFALMSLFSTGGFFLNAYPGTESATLDLLSGLKGYICAGNCTPAGDAIVNQGQLNYSGFINWNVTGGNVDLIGPGLFDLLPGNGLYVDLAGSTAPAYGLMTSKNTFSLDSGHAYRLSVTLAGNQRLDAQPYSARVRVYYMSGSSQVDLINQLLVINDYTQDFTAFSFTFNAPADVAAYISVQEIDEPDQTGRPSVDQFFGLLLGSVKFDDTTTVTNLLNDNFDGENPVYVPPACGRASVYYDGQYAVGYNCYGTGCLTSPPPQQLPDPNALPDIESGFTPPTVYNSTKLACAKCPTGFTNGGGNLIPAMTSDTLPSGIADASDESQFPAWYAFTGVIFNPWVPAGSPPQWLRYQFPAAQTVAAYGVAADSFTGSTFQFQGSNDGTTWTTLDTQTNNYSVNGQFETQFPIATPQAFTQYRLLISATSGGAAPSVYLLTMYAVSSQQICATASAQSTVSQSQADTDAYNAALAIAQPQLNCKPVFTATEQFTAKCQNAYGQDVTKSATATSYISLQNAQDIATRLATEAANTALDCTQSNNTQKITINDDTHADPYPSVKFIAGSTGNITKVTVSLPAFSHGYPNDVRVMLRHPDGTTCLLMGWAGGTAPVGPVNLVFDDAGATTVPTNTVVSATYKPTQIGLSNANPMLPPAPAQPYGTTLSVFNGKTANGAWSLWVEDDAFLNSGQFASGFDLTITTA